MPSICKALAAERLDVSAFGKPALEGEWLLLKPVFGKALRCGP